MTGDFMSSKVCNLRALLLLLIACASSATSASNSCAANDIDVEGLFPASGETMDVLELKYPARMEELFGKLNKAIKKDPEWWQSHVRKATPGSPLPYDERMGMTEKEYEEFLVVGKSATLEKVKSINPEIKYNGQQLEIHFGKDLPGLEKVVVDLDKDIVTTPMGAANERSTIEATDGQKVTGPWDGVQWMLQEVDRKAGKQTVITVAFGKLKKSGRGLLYFDFKQSGKNAKPPFFYVLQYDLKAAK
jgi:hypothetical protein